MAKAKVIKKRVKKPLTLRQVLNVIDGVLLGQDKTAKDLWNVLTALRGPDVEEYSLKRDHTIPIRRAAFPKMTKASETGEETAPADFGTNSYGTNKYSSPIDNYNHFGRHVEYAADSLGLTGGNNE